MEQYEPLKMEVIEFETEDVITASGQGWTKDITIPGLPSQSLRESRGERA